MVTGERRNPTDTRATAPDTRLPNTVNLASVLDLEVDGDDDRLDVDEVRGESVDEVDNDR